MLTGILMDRLTVVMGLRKARTSSRITEANNCHISEERSRWAGMRSRPPLYTSGLMSTSPSGTLKHFDDQEKSQLRRDRSYEWISRYAVFPWPSLPETASLYQTAFAISFAA